MKIEHIAMYVNNLEKARQFFMRYFNAQSNELYHNRATDFRSYFLTFEGGARLEIMSKPLVSPINTNNDTMGYAHIAISVGNKENVNELSARLKEDGYLLEREPRTTGDGYYESCVVGVEGCRIEITV